MNLKNLSVKKIPSQLNSKLLNKKIKSLYNLFKKRFQINNNFIVAVSGGPDSLALAFLTKIYSIQNQLNCKYYIVDHKLRKESTEEAKKVKKVLKRLSIQSQILTWTGSKPKKNIQSLARKNRYNLLFSQCKKHKINTLVLGHHLDDVRENFFIRMIRGSGLKGLVSLNKKTKINEINIIRPLIEFKKKDLIFLSSKVFNFFVKDPSNEKIKYTRIRIRRLIAELEKNGFDKDKLFLTIKNLKNSDNAISFYVEQNNKKNAFFDEKKNKIILSKDFFNNPHEIVFRSFSDCIMLIGKKYNPTRGKKIDHILEKIKKNVLIKETLGGCVIKSLNQSIIVDKE